jgi:hypothetical protein
MSKKSARAMELARSVCRLEVPVLSAMAIGWLAYRFFY